MTWWVMKMTASPRAWLHDDPQDVARLLDAERRRGLVEDQHAGAEMDRAGDGERLALAAREAADQAVAVVDAGDAEVWTAFTAISLAVLRS